MVPHQPSLVTFHRPRCQSIAEYLTVGSGLVSTLHGTEASAETDSKGNPTDKDPEKTAFGGLRVILVRDEKTQYELQRKVPTSTLVLTILQSKGMEFDDVFLYNFFSTSSYSSDFKVLGDLLRERHSLEAGELTRYANWKKVDSVSDLIPPRLLAKCSQPKFQILCSELKVYTRPVRIPISPQYSHSTASIRRDHSGTNSVVDSREQRRRCTSSDQSVQQNSTNTVSRAISQPTPQCYQGM